MPGRIAFLLAATILAALPGVMQAGDRHVYLDVDGDGQLNDCPNPAHNASAVADTAELTACRGGSADGRIIGSADGRVDAGTCSAGGGSVQPSSGLYLEHGQVGFM